MIWPRDEAVTKIYLVKNCDPATVDKYVDETPKP